MGDAVHVVGPSQTNAGWVFLCPECDADRVEGVQPDSARICTRVWLTGRQLSCQARFGDRTCNCWESDPYEGEEAATDRQRRFFHYVTIALLLGGAGRRVDLPLCVKENIEQQYGASTTGFQA
mmetsp:Transcript_18070/g.45289  ORF Transcript_18070/g.45289 Transcript_18070/m.45289 type:complete len:123 (+) Transcript_18070:34-402(+)